MPKATMTPMSSLCRRMIWMTLRRSSVSWLM
jgi:hypothetical protein